ncbi:MAG TPA: hypothetical protein DEP46_07105, partial [Blastocatellia bacterium]|nr:hypothetical protein [Blastocatellia bacterium]
MWDLKGWKKQITTTLCSVRFACTERENLGGVLDKMKRTIIGLLIVGAVAILPALAHDLFLKPDSFFTKAGGSTRLSVMNGTFKTSEGAVAFSRLTDASIVSPGGKRASIGESNFAKNETTAFIDIATPDEGNYVVGLSTNWRENALAAKEFNEYLTLEGIPGVLDERKRDNELDKDARYRYSKYVKTILQAGKKSTDDYKVVLGYAVEMIPQQNPYKSKPGQTIDILCLRDGKPLVGQTVLVGYDSGSKMASEKSLKSDSSGLIKIKLESPGKWYAKF